jgi:PEGA domain-containing protein
MFHRSRRPAFAALGVLVLSNLGACATVIHGGRQDVGISSTPTGALVRVDGTEAGRTPVILPLVRGRHHVVEVSADGYLPCSATVTRSTSGWVWGNLFIGGLIGLGMDALSGAMWQLDPESIYCDLHPQAAVSGREVLPPN